LAQTARDTTFIAKAYIEMGSLSRNQSQFNDALAYYKKVVEEMPMSGYAEDALAAIESIYQTRNEPEEYLAYIDNIGKGGSKSEDEKENMIFNAAEQNYLAGNYQKALVALQGYIEKYPEGRYVGNVDFYMAESYRNLGKYEQACDGYRKVINAGVGSFVELSMLHFSDLSYKLERWADAFGGYTSLQMSARFDNNKVLAMKGMMRSAFKGHMWEEALKNADRILFDSRMETEVKREAEYVKAKAYMATS
jgi:tetratricopeptide (TPR) repeat protein